MKGRYRNHRKRKWSETIKLLSFRTSSYKQSKGVFNGFIWGCFLESSSSGQYTARKNRGKLFFTPNRGIGIEMNAKILIIYKNGEKINPT